MSIYTHKAARDMSYEEYAELVSAMRQRRLMIAIEFEEARQRRNRAMVTKFGDQWDRLDTRINSLLEKVRIDLSKADDYLNKLSELNNKITLVED